MKVIGLILIGFLCVLLNIALAIVAGAIVVGAVAGAAWLVMTVIEKWQRFRWR